VPGASDVAIFSISSVNSAQSIQLRANQAALGLVFQGSNTATTALMGGGTNRVLTLGTSGMVVNSGAGAVTLGSTTSGQYVTLTLSGAQTWTNNSANALTVVNAITNGGYLLSSNGTGDTAINGAIGGAGGLTKSGDGTLTLNGANTYSGFTTVNAGTLALGATNTLGTGAIIIDGATAVLSLGASHADTAGTVTLANGGSITGTGGSTLTSSGTFEMQSGTVSAILAGSGIALNKTTSGTVTLSGVNTYTGLTTVSAGTLEYGVTNALSTGEVMVAGGSLDLNTFSDTVGAVTLSSGSITGSTGVLTGTSYSLTNTGSVSAILAGTAALTKTGAGTATLSGTNTYTGVTTLTAGTLSVGSIGNGGVAGNLGQATNAASNLVFNGGTLQYTGADATTNRNFTLNAGTTGTFDITTNNLTISGASTATTGALTKIGAGTLTLAGNNLYTGLTTVNEGTLAFGVSNALSTGAVTVDGATAVLSLGASHTGSVGTVTLANGGSITGTGTSALTSTGTFEMQSGTVSAILAGSGIALNKTTAGTVTLAGVNTYTGLTTVSAGTLEYGVTNALSSGDVTVAGGTLDINTFSDTVGAVTLSSGSITGSTGVLTGTSYNLTNTGSVSAILAGATTLTKSGAGTATLSGTNTYSGVTTLTAGILNVASLSNYGVAGSLGSRLESAEATTDVGIHFTGGTLQYTGATAQSTDRGIRVGLAGGTIDASGSIPTATMSFTKSTANVDVWDTDGARTLTLTGSNTGNNTFAINWQERAAGHSNIVKSGAGTWVLTNSHNSDAQTDAYNVFGGYGGGTNLVGGTLGFTNNAIGGGVVDFTGNATLRWEAGNTQDITTGSGAGVTRSVKIEDGVTATFNTNGNNVTLSNALAVGALKTGALTKAGAGTLTLSAVNTYAGATTVNGGKLTIASTGTINSTSAVTIAGGEFNYNSATALSRPVSFSGTGGTLSGTGTITPAVTVTSGNTYTAGAVGAAGTQTFSNALTFNSGSIFQWDLAATPADTGSGAANSGSYDKVVANGAVTGTAVFQVVLGSNAFTDAFWDTDKTWSNIFTGSGSFNLASMFTTFGGAGIVPYGAIGLVPGQGQFTFTYNTLRWTAVGGGFVPEPTNALAALLLAAGLLRRRR
jgi:autotransporter-associated beta strand protein